MDEIEAIREATFLDVIISMRALSLADIRSATRNQRDEFERVAKGLVETIRAENAHDQR